jgi:hypothetical protein
MIGRASLAVLAGVLVAAAGCTQPRDPVTVEEGVITVENQTRSEWKNVRIVVNDYFGGGVASLAPGQRLNALLSNMQTGLGQRFDRGRMSVYKVEVTATDAAGAPVKLTWGGDRPARQQGSTP